MESKGFFLAAIFAAVMCISGSVFAVLSGSGTEATPYLIQSQADFDEFANPANGGIYWASGVYTQLMCDPNLADTTYTQAVIAPDTNSSTSGFQGTQFTGVFDGNGHTISNLTINQPTKDYIGLFGYMGTNGQVKNLGLENVSITGRNIVGSLVGQNSSGTITSCFANGFISATGHFIGGLCGRNITGTIDQCRANVNSVTTGIFSPSPVAGGLCGRNETGTITNSYAMGNLTGTGYTIGGLCGENYGASASIYNCYSTGVINANSNSGDIYTGGLCGSSSGSISHCYSTSNTTTNASMYSYTGGFCGLNTGIIESSYAKGNVSGWYNVGGFCGKNSGASAIITQCYATGAVSGTGNGNSYIGGFLGVLSEVSLSAYPINGCFSTGMVTGMNYVGGFGGRGSLSTATYNCFWDIQSSGQSLAFGSGTSSGTIGKMTAQMKDIQTYLVAGWWFVYGDAVLGDWIMPADSYPKLVWEEYNEVIIPDFKGLTEQQAQTMLTAAGVILGKTYFIYDPAVSPGLISETYPQSGTTVYAGLTPVYLLVAKDYKYAGGDGTATPYQISDPGNWLELVLTPEDCNKPFALTSDIDFEKMNLLPIARDTVPTVAISSEHKHEGISFTGTFNGNSFYVRNIILNLPKTDYVGLFGLIKQGGQVSDLVVENVLAIGSYHAGGLCGGNSGTVERCSTAGSVNGQRNVGGLAGYNSEGSITSCYATCEVNGIDTVGGFVGGNSFGPITSCYASGEVSGSDNVGGLVGSIGPNDSITSCYANGAVAGTRYVGGLVGSNMYHVSVVTSCFWDKGTSGRTTSAGGTGKTTAEMMMLSTFTTPPANWDFSDTDGDAADWMMLRPNEDYPRLAWQTIFAGDITGLYGVDMEDLNVLIEYWLGTWRVKADIVDDSIVNLMDLSVIGQNWMLTECGDCNGADITGDGNVDIQDTAVLADQWLFQENPDCQQADIDNSGTVDLADLSILAANWMTGI